MQSEKIIYKNKTKTGRIISFRYPTIDDLQIITNFMNKISKERTFISFQGEEIKLENEKKWLKSTIQKIKNKEKVYIMAFIGKNFVGSSDIDLQDKIKFCQGFFGIIIDKDFRGDGIGKILMEQVIKEAKKNMKNLKIITLEVFGSNSIAQNLYKKLGFVEFGRLPEGIKYKNEFIDEVLMYKKI